MYCCINHPVILGGTTKTIRAEFFNDGQTPFDLQGHTVYFTLSDYVNPYSSPIIRKKAEILDNGGLYNIASVDLTPQDTVDVFGRFRYRFTVVNQLGETDAITGDIMVEICTDKESVT